MVVDPFTALSLAASIVQFVDFGTRTASKISELYNSASGLTQNQDEILESAQRFEKLAERLSRVSLPEENDASVIVDHASISGAMGQYSPRDTRQSGRKRHEIEQLVDKMKELHDFLNTYLLALLW